MKSIAYKIVQTELDTSTKTKVEGSLCELYLKVWRLYKDSNECHSWDFSAKFEVAPSCVEATDFFAGGFDAFGCREAAPGRFEYGIFLGSLGYEWVPFEPTAQEYFEFIEDLLTQPEYSFSEPPYFDYYFPDY